MNKKGSTIFIVFMLGAVFILLALALAPALTDVSDEARATAELDCNNASISNQNKAVCTQIDAFPFLYTGIVLGLAGILLGWVLIR